MDISTTIRKARVHQSITKQKEKQPKINVDTNEYDWCSEMKVRTEREG